MSPVSLIFTVLATYFCFANGQSACSPPGGGSGVCKSIYECPSLMKIIGKSDKTEQDIAILKNSQCGLNGESNKACCPNPSCYTPEGQPGECVSIYSCPSLANLLKPPVSVETTQYVRNYVCKSNQEFSVCCAIEGSPSPSVAAPGACAATVSAFPPDPRTGCCGVESTAGDRILGGNATTVEQYPWLILVEYIQQGKMKTACGGSLISARYVLSAGHCVVGRVLNQVGKPVSIRLGEYDKRNNGKDCITVAGGGTDCTDGIIQIQIEQIIVHPDYNPSMRQSPNDIALIRLKESAPYTDFIRPICLPREDVTAFPPENFPLFAAGWGETDTHVTSNVKMHVNLAYTDRNECNNMYRNLKVNITPRQICAGGGDKDSGKGDSGGPLMYENLKYYEVIGVISYGPRPCGPNEPKPCARFGIPGVYTKVYEFLPWIRQTIVA